MTTQETEYRGATTIRNDTTLNLRTQTFEYLISTEGRREYIQFDIFSPLPNDVFGHVINVIYLNSHALRSSNPFLWTFSPYARYFLFKDAPFYIQALAHPVIKQYKNSVVTISDDLPIFISMRVTLHPENQREDVLSVLVHFLNAKDLITNEVNYIIRDKSISLRESLDSIVKLTGVQTQTSFSYCLTCGREIESGKKFCDSTKYRYKNKNHCLIQFNYWLKARLGIKTTKSRSRMRNQFCKEMVELIKEFPLDAWEQFKRRNPRLFEKQYKERSERERRLKR